MKPDDELEQLFGKARGELAPPEGAAERVHQAVMEAIRAPAPPTDGGTGAATTGSAVGGKLIGGVALAIVVGGALYALLGGTDPKPDEPAASSPPAAAPAPVPLPVESASESDPEPVPEEPSATSEPPPPPSVPRAPATPGASAQGSDPLAEELALMKRARTALASGASAEALALLDEHAQRFPRGVLAPERTVSRIRALCALGRLSEARAAYQRIARGASRSPHLASLRRSCPGLEPEAP